MDVTAIRDLHVETSSRCNARCSSCGRSDHGGELSPGLVIQDLDSGRLAEVLALFPNLEAIQFCGNLGDPVAARNVMEHVAIAVEKSQKNDCFFQIHTNGSLRNQAWWRELARMLHPIKHEVLFAIDGLKDTHHIYRQSTSFEKIIENAKAFIDEGGHAVWQFIPFQHNQHQIIDCLRMSHRLGFKRFVLFKQARIPPRTWDVNTRSWIKLSPWDQDANVNPDRAPERIIRNQVLPKDCFHLEKNSLFLNANGTFSSCCYQGFARQSSDINELPDILSELSSNPHKICLEKCGSCASIG